MIALLPALVLAACASWSGTDDAARLPALERELIELQRLRDAVLLGHDPDLTRLRARIPDRLELLKGMDPAAFRALGIGPAQLRARLLSGVEEELRALHDQDHDGSTLLRRMLELEEELHARALVRLRQWGLPEPFGLAATTDRLAAGSAPRTDADGAPDPAPAPGAPSPAEAQTPASLDPSARALLAVAAYTRGDWTEALQHYRGLDGALDESTLEQHYRLADCLMKLRRTREAADAFKVLAERYPALPLGRRAAWNAKVAESLALLDADRDDRR